MTRRRMLNGLALLWCATTLVPAAAAAAAAPPPATAPKTAPTTAPATRPAAKDVRVAIAGETISVNGKAIPLPADPRVLTAVLGPPDRSWQGANLIMTWDDLGLYALVQPDGPRQLIQISIALDREVYKFYPRRNFAGTLELDGARVTATTTIEDVNRAKVGTKLAQDEIVGSLHSIQYKRTLLTVSRPDKELAAPASNIGEVSLCWRGPDKAK